MTKRVLNYRNSKIGYCIIGSGPNICLCFHGYGEEASRFAFLENLAGRDYSFFALDLPFHGATIWAEGLNFTHTDLQQIIHEILLENGYRKPERNQMISIMGFSLGGRIALSIYQAWPDVIDKIVLLAPDGMKVNFWYRIATRTWIGKHLFGFTMKKPKWFFYLLKAFNRFDIVNASVFKFVNHYISDRHARLVLYQRWISLRRLKPNLKKIKSCIRQNKTPVRLLYGRHDRIILPTRGEKFITSIEEYATLRVIESGHQILHEKHEEEIIEALRN
jgi:pimeloyl-ACP methyl ester carboxylesterase